jgi:hypothetical protein
MLSDERYRAWVVRQIKDPVLRMFWTNEFGRYDKRFLQEAIAPIQNKVGQLLMAPELRNILGQVRNRVDARFMMDKGRIFIANLSKGKIGPDKASLLGSLWVTQFQLAAMSRADVPEEERRDFHLYVDEFQSFVSDSFAAILSEARKYRICLSLSNQHLDQIKPGILSAILGNVGSIVAFRIGPEDAQVFERTFGMTYIANQFTTLNNGEVYVKLLENGQYAGAFFGRTFPPEGKRHGHRDAIIDKSRAKYAEKRETMERKVRAWLEA